MNLYIMRHGPALSLIEAGVADDRERPLSRDGGREVNLAARAIKRLRLSFDLILSSPFLRARQTAQIVAEALQTESRMAVTPGLAPGADYLELVDEIRGRSDVKDVLLVGHEPHLSGLISLLMSGDTTLEIKLKKGGLCRVQVTTLHPGRCAVLQWLLSPRQLSRIE